MLRGLYSRYAEAIRSMIVAAILGGAVAVVVGLLMFERSDEAVIVYPGAGLIVAGALAFFASEYYEWRRRKTRQAAPLTFSDTYSRLHDKAEKPYTTAVIELHAPDRLALAELLESTFDVAEWVVSIRHEPVGTGPAFGVVVSGAGAQYVDALTTGLRNDGLPDVTRLVGSDGLPSDDGERRVARMRVTVAIGPEAKCSGP